MRAWIPSFFTESLVMVWFVWMLFGTIILLYFRQRRELMRLRAETQRYEMEHSENVKYARQKNYAGQIKNRLRKLVSELDPHGIHLVVESSGPYERVMVGDLLPGLGWIVRVELDLAAKPGEPLMETIFASGHTVQYQDTPGDLQRLIAEAEDYLRKTIKTQSE